MSEQPNTPRAFLPEPTLRRLPWYLAYISMLHATGVEHVSSTQIAKELSVDASQIAKDLSFLNIVSILLKHLKIGIMAVSLSWMIPAMEVHMVVYIKLPKSNTNMFKERKVLIIESPLT